MQSGPKLQFFFLIYSTGVGWNCLCGTAVSLDPPDDR